MKKEFKHYYEVKYASSMYDSTCRKTLIVIGSDEEYKISDFVLIYKKGQGVFIGVITKQEKNACAFEYSPAELYSIEMTLDLSEFISNREKQKRKAQLKKEMEKKMASIDAELKLQLYASQNPEFAEMYKEYSSI